jgi:predicted dehydrogenase
MRHLIRLLSFAGAMAAALPAEDLRLGMVGLDTGHVVIFTKILNDGQAKDHVAGAKVVAAVTAPSMDIESARTVYEGYVTKLKNDFGVTFYNSIAEMAGHVDGIMIESVDGRPHLEQAKAAILTGKPVYIEKPIAASLSEAQELFAFARQHKVAVFSSSALRYGIETQAVRNGKIGRVREAETMSPAHLEPHHTDLFWYGVHGVESLFTVMGTGIESVTRKSSTPGAIVSEGTWRGGRVGTFKEITRAYGGKAQGEKGTADVGKFDGYAPLISAVVTFFQTGKSPVPDEETLEIIAFMEADALSKARGGVPVKISEVKQLAAVKAR